MALTYQQLLTAVPLVLRAGNVPNIVGDAGIGKSALVEEVADQMGADLFTTVVSLSEKGDLAIPVPPLTNDSFVETKGYGRLANVQFGYSETLIRIIKDAEAHPGRTIIWFLDEFNRGTAAVQSELMNLVLQRRINALRLPATVKIIIAENPDSTMAGFGDREYAVATADAAIKDRTVRLVMTTATVEWLAWAKRTGINQLVINYLTTYPERLSILDPENLDLHPTPRAWERVSRNLNQLRQLPPADQQSLAADLFSGDLGTEVGVSFAQFVLAQDKQLNLEAIQTKAASRQSFVGADEATKVRLLREWVADDQRAPLASAAGATAFADLLDQVSPDGQFAIAQAVGGQLDQVIQPMYELAKEEPAGPVAKLYRHLAEIATHGGQH
ncbi:ATP-binding protein [Limosilactobacillus pontis]|uniref:ATP-binding protein n=1 Tax=Limosilactobacillus pontis TaxID=35787 RepID=UPI00224683A3|nr:ATP-binding protein [Limosilactobacillus pontis]MCX2187337.1 ATP-binding protein [Limosilactobacillus pontis]MCX2189107.1 ATP-binding protein [Limosilactobacillus pontis]